MPDLKRPGVYVEENSFPTFVTQTTSGSVAVFLGPHNRGPLTPKLVQSWTEFTRYFGGFDGVTAPSALALAAYAYFNNGGRLAYIQRVVHTDAAAATLQLKDTATTPANTLLVTAINPGGWGNNLYIDITSGSAVGLFNLTVRYGGTGDSFVVERWTDLSMNAADPSYVVSVINNISQGSRFITVTDSHSATTPPNNLPANIAAAQLGQTPNTPGADGTAVTATDQENTFPNLDLIDGPLLLNLPGISDTGILGQAINYCEGRANAVLIIDTAAGLDAATAVTNYASMSASSYAAVYYPWILVSDPASNAPGSVRKIPPGGFVMGVIANTDASRGVAKAPAGLQARLTSAVGVERKIGNSDADTLNVAKINAIRQFPGAGIVVYGARTLSSVVNTRYLNVRRQLIEIRENLLSLTRFAVFEPNDYILWNTITSLINQYLTSLWQSGGLSGATSADAFYIVCNASNNTPQTIANGEVHVEVGVAASRPAEFIVITVGQWAGGSQTSEIAA